MPRLNLAKYWKVALSVLSIAAINAAVVMSVTSVSYAAMDQMMHDYAGSSISTYSD